MSFDAITLKQLRSLVAVAQTRSLTAAAALMNLTTPAIHSQIKKLEDQIGRPLVERHSEATGFVLTPAGQMLVQAAQRIEANLSQAAAQVQALTQGYQGHVTVSVVSTAKYFAPRLVRLLRDSCPEIAVTLRVGNREQVISDLAQGGAELAIMGRPPRVPMVQASPLGPHPHGVILPPGHMLAGKDGFDPGELVAQTFLSREEGSGTRVLMTRFLDALMEGQQPDLVVMESNETIKQAVMAGLGVAFLSMHTVQDELVSGRLVALRGPGLPVMRQWYLVCPLQSPASAATQRIQAAILDLGGAYFPKG